MTETLGWGDVGVDDAPRRRRRRLPRVVVWVALAAVVVGIAIWPTAKDTVTNHAAAWLDRQWRVGSGYDASRSAIELDAAQRAAAADAPTVVRLVEVLDGEESAKLTALAGAISHHRMWAASVARAGNVVRQAFLAEARDLRDDVHRVPETVPLSVFVPNPYSADTQTAVERASAQVQRMLHDRHMKPDTRKTAALTSADPELAELRSVTAAPLDLRLAVTDDSQLDVWDLRTGSVRKNVIGYLPVNLPTGVLPAAGSSLLAQFDVNWQLWPTDGPRPISLPTESPNAYYQADGNGGLWRTDEGRIRRYDADGHPAGPWHRYPAGMEMDPMAATSDAIVGNLAPVNFYNPRPVLWYPDSGRIVALDDPCAAAFVAAGRTIAYMSCGQDVVSLVDTRSGRTRRVRLPAGLSLQGQMPVLSPDGSRMALLAQPQLTDDPPSLYVFDLHTNAVTHLDSAAAPLVWSPDGSVLLVDVNGNDPSAPTATTSSFAPLAYWKLGMTSLAGIRINLQEGSFGLAVLP